MKKNFIFLFVILASSLLFAQNKEKEIAEKEYQDFLKLNSSSINIEKTVLTKQRIINYKGDKGQKSQDYVYCLLHKNGQCVQIKAKNKIQYFFSSDQGYWLFTNKLKSPLKVQGSYKVEEADVQDILKLDFEKEYDILDFKDSILSLERKGQKSAYKFIFFEKTSSNEYTIIFADNKKNPVRKLVYHSGEVDGINTFKQIDIYNLLFKRKAYSSWVTESIKEVNIPSSFFSYSKIKQLTEKMSSILKEENKK